MPLDGEHSSHSSGFDFGADLHASQPAGYVKPSFHRSRTASVSTTAPQKGPLSIRKRPSLPSLNLPFLPRRSITDGHSRTPSAAGTPPLPIDEPDNSDLLDDDPFAADTSRFGCIPSSASLGFSISTSSTPSLASASLASSTRSSRDSDMLDDDSEEGVELEEEEIKVEQFHRLPPSPHSALRRTRSRPSLAGRPSLPCLAELETRPLSEFDCPPPKSAVAKAKAKAGKLPVEPWDSLPDSSATPTPELPAGFRSMAVGNGAAVGEVRCHRKRGSAYADLAVALGVLGAGGDGDSTGFVSTTTMAAGDSYDEQISTGEFYAGYAYGYSKDEGSSFGNYSTTTHSTSYRRGEGDDGDDQRRRRNNKWGSDLELKSAWSDEEEGEEDGKGHASTPSTSSSSSSEATSPQKQQSNWTREEDEEDDVPLAKQIPTALTAQKSIRANLREERYRKRHEKLAQLKADYMQKTNARDKASQDSKKAEILVNKLLEIQSRVHGTSAGGETQSPSTPTPAPVEDTSRLLRTPRSGNPVSTPQTPELTYSPLARSSTTVTPRPRPTTRSRSQTRGTGSSRPPNWDAYQESCPSPMPTPSRISEPGYHRERERGREGVSNAPSGSTQPGLAPAAPVRRANTVGSGRRRTTSVDEKGLPPVPPLPSTEHKTTLPELPPKALHPMRIFIHESSRYVNMELEETTTAKEVVEFVKAKEELRDYATLGEEPGEWMLWELANEFNMERPIRSFERVLDVTASWNTDKRVNALIMKKTTFGPLLRKNAIPSVAPQFASYVEWESRKGKWNKRWLELRESSLFLCKKEHHKQDEVFLCSLSNFDAYAVSPRHRSPKGFAFAVRSTDNATLFENPADYMHIFSCDAKTGKEWLSKLLVGRSLVLLQERTILFRAPATVTFDHTTGRRLAPATPLLDITSGPTVTAPSPVLRSAPAGKTSHGPFEPGSLLAKHLNPTA